MDTHGHLVNARRDDLMRTAARCRLATQVRHARAPRRHRATAGRVWLLAGLRARKVPA
jgi:hypothetical protein